MLTQLINILFIFFTKHGLSPVIKVLYKSFLQRNVSKLDLNFIKPLMPHIGIRNMSIKGRKKLVPYIISEAEVVKNFIKFFIVFIKTNKILLKDSINKFFELLDDKNILLKNVTEPYKIIGLTTHELKLNYKSRAIVKNSQKINNVKKVKKYFFKYI